MPRSKSWKQIQREAAISDAEIIAHERLDAAEDSFHAVRRRRGIDDAAFAAALEREPEDLWSLEPDGDLWLFALARWVAAAGGRLELRAVFDDETVVLLSEPQPQPQPQPDA